MPSKVQCPRLPPAISRYPAIYFILLYYTILYIYYIQLSSYLKMGKPAVAILLLADKPSSYLLYVISTCDSCQMQLLLCCVSSAFWQENAIFVAKKIIVEEENSSKFLTEPLYL